jgi:DNA-binding protein HU-beta
LDLGGQMTNQRMSQAQMVRSLAEAGEIPNKTARLLLDKLSSLAVSEVKKNGVFVLPGFGRLVKVERKARPGRAVATGESIKILAKEVVKFHVTKAGKSTQQTVAVPSKAKPIQHDGRSAEADLIRNALAVIGSPERLAEWMQTSIPALRGRTPYSLMDTKDGRKEVEIVLGRIEHGIY